MAQCLLNNYKINGPLYIAEFIIHSPQFDLSRLSYRHLNPPINSVLNWFLLSSPVCFVH